MWRPLRLTKAPRDVTEHRPPIQCGSTTTRRRSWTQSLRRLLLFRALFLLSTMPARTKQQQGGLKKHGANRIYKAPGEREWKELCRLPEVNDKITRGDGPFASSCTSAIQIQATGCSFYSIQNPTCCFNYTKLPFIFGANA